VLALALKQLPSSYEARVAMGAALSRGGDPEGAKDQLQAAVLIDPKRAEARLQIAQMQIAAGNRAAARQQLQAVLQSDPTNTEAKRMLQQIAPVKRPQ
jgi:Tfp pilus assembly protein PilF